VAVLGEINVPPQDIRAISEWLAAKAALEEHHASASTFSQALAATLSVSCVLGCGKKRGRRGTQVLTAYEMA
jgi:hypothetical protein